MKATLTYLAFSFFAVVGAERCPDAGENPVEDSMPTLVRIKACPACEEVQEEAFGGSVVRLEPGLVVAPREEAEAARYTFIQDGYHSVVKYFTPRDGEGFEVVMTPALEWEDWDDDGLSDAYEQELGTLVRGFDTDRDGLPDGWEVLGHDWLDYTLHGVDPGHRDVLVEVDYQHRDGRTRLLSNAVVDRLVATLAELAIENPDGSEGIRLHLVFDDQLEVPADGTCSYGRQSGARRAGFHHATLCEGVEFGGGSSPGTFSVQSPRANDDPADDATERAQYVWFASFLHEFGHSLGVCHGGDESVGCKPNYQSVMNYGYARGLNEHRTLESGRLRFSQGGLPDLDENQPIECPALAGATPSGVATVAHYGASFAPDFRFSVADGCVDWNRDGDFADGVVPAVRLRPDHAKCNRPGDPLRVLSDADDVARIEAYLPLVIDGIDGERVRNPCE